MVGQPFHVRASVDSGFRNQRSIRRQPRKPFGRCQVDRQVAKIAVVDADQRRSERERAAHFRFVMNLDQRIHAKAACLADDLPRLEVVEQRQHHQYSVGARNSGLDDLPPVDEEVLGKNWSIECRARRPQIVGRASEELAIRKHAQGIGNAGIAACNRSRVRVASDRAGRGRRLLDLQNEGGSGLLNSVEQTTPGRPGFGPKRIKRNTVETAREFLFLGRSDFGKDSDWLRHWSPR